MRTRSLPLYGHLVLLCLFSIAMVGVWLLPALLARMPFLLPNLESAWTVYQTGAVPRGDGRLAAIVFAFLIRWIDWSDFLGWTALSAGVLGIALPMWWWGVWRLFDARIAWLSTVILSFMPLYWLEALVLGNYTFSFFFLFLSFAAFIELTPRSRLGGIALSGIFFGICIAFKDTFIIFLPWYVVAYLWIERQRWKRGIVEVALFIACVGALYTLPIVGNVVREDAPLIDKILHLLPLERSKPGPGEFYGDAYTYDFDREWFEKKVLRERAEAQSFLERMRGENRLLSFGVGEGGIFTSLRNGVWLFLHSIPHLFLQDTIGGIVLWLFILPGIGMLWFKNRRLLWLIAGLMLTTQILIRFVLHFQRIHLMNDGWALALLVALGIVAVSDALSSQWKKISSQTLSVIIVVVLAGQLLQANRSQLARLYSRTDVPDRLAAAAVIRQVPEDALVALSISGGFSFLSGRKTFVLKTRSVERALERGILADVIDYYGITHVMRYSDELTERIVEAVPEIIVLPPAPGAPTRPDVTPFMNYLLHLIR